MKCKLLQNASIVQWIVHKSSKLRILVRFQLGVQNISINMNIIQINIPSDIRCDVKKTMIKSKDFVFGGNTAILILSEKDLNDPKLIINLRGYGLDLIMIPKGSCLNNKLTAVLAPCMQDGLRISYY